MESELEKLRIQIEYIEKIEDTLSDMNDGGLYHDFTEEEEKIYLNFLDFMIDLKILKEKQLKKIEKNLIKMLTN